MQVQEYNKESHKLSFKSESGKIEVRHAREKDGLVVLSYKNEKYFQHSEFSMGYGSTNKLIKITQEMLDMEPQIKYGGWDRYEEVCRELVERYNGLETESTSVPSGPDTSKFRATKSGFIRVLARGDRFGSSHYTSGTYIHKGIQVGGNVRGATELINLIIYVSKRMSTRLKLDGGNTNFRMSLGTNFSTFGIGC